MNSAISQQRRPKADETSDDDADVYADKSGIDRREGLPSDDSGYETEAGDSRRVEEKRKGDNVQAAYNLVSRGLAGREMD